MQQTSQILSYIVGIDWDDSESANVEWPIGDTTDERRHQTNDHPTDSGRRVASSKKPIPER